MDALLRQLLDRAEHAGGEDWIRLCLSLPQPTDASSAESGATAGPSGAEVSYTQPCLSENATSLEQEVADMTDSMEDGAGRRTSKRRRTQRRSLSPSSPVPTGGEREVFSFSRRDTQASQAPPPLGRGRGRKNATPIRERAPPGSLTSASTRAGRGGRGGRRGAGPPPQQEQLTSRIPVRCESPTPAPGALPAQGSVGECGTASQLSVLSASIEQLIAVMKANVSTPVLAREAEVWSGMDTNTILQPACSAYKEDSVKSTDSNAKECMPCLLSPLGFHLPISTKDKIWKGEYVDLVSLLPPAKDMSRYDRKDEKADDRKPAIKSFYAWLQAFITYASVLCEKYPEQSPFIFQHIDIILEAYKGFSGLAWLYYDEAFRQKLAVQPSLQWGSKDVGLWLNMFLPQRLPPARSNTLQASHPSTSSSYRKGLCFSFNDSHCKWANACKYKHECAACGGGHPITKCFRKLQPNQRENLPKSTHPGEAFRNASLASNLPKQAEGFPAN